MSEPLKDAEAVEVVEPNEEKLESLEQLPDVTDAEVVEEPEAVALEPEETEAQRLVREATERFAERAQEPMAQELTPREAYLQGQLQAIKEAIAQRGRTEEPTVGHEDDEFLEDLTSPGVVAAFEAAKDDPAAQLRMFGVIAKKMLEANPNQDVKALEQKLSGLETSIRQAVGQRQNQQMFQQGLEAVRGIGEVGDLLVRDFEDKQEWGHWQAHIQAHGPTLEGYQPKSLLGEFLMRPGNIGFAATPAMMKAGALLLMNEMGVSGAKKPTRVSTTGAAARVKSGSGEETGEELTPEDQILQGILNAAAHRRKAKAFG